MNVRTVGNVNSQYNMLVHKKSSFKGSQCENQANKDTVKKFAILNGAGAGVMAGVVTAGIVSRFVDGGLKNNKKLLCGIGTATAFATFASTTYAFFIAHGLIEPPKKNAVE